MIVKRTYSLQEEDLSDGEKEGNDVAEKNKRITFDFDYIEDSQEEKEEDDIIASTASIVSIASIASTTSLDSEDSSDPTSPILMPAKAVKAVKPMTAVETVRITKVPRKADAFVPLKSICIEVPYLNGEGIEITTRFNISIEAAGLDDSIPKMLGHIHCPNLPQVSWPENLLYKMMADMIRKRYLLETNEAWVNLKDEFIEEYKHIGVLAHALVYLTPDFTLKQHKTSKPSGTIRHGGKKTTTVPLINLDDPECGMETANNVADAVIKFKGAVKPVVALMDVLKNFKDHEGRFCHRDHTGKHHIMNFSLYSIWAKELNMSTPGITIYSLPNDPAFESIPASWPNSNVNIGTSLPTPTAPPTLQNIPQMYIGIIMGNPWVPSAQPVPNL
ncbi:hypothetical protein K439DRAFT_1624040 [Ramaria rubella]|nr:hypothetical protein K439DRAFT_1624040 [Ramaria rubella]